MPETMKRNIVMMGAPGSGKGTQSAILSEKLGINAFSMGDILRSVACQDSEEGRSVKALIEKGKTAVIVVLCVCCLLYLSKSGCLPEYRKEVFFYNFRSVSNLSAYGHQGSFEHRKQEF